MIVVSDLACHIYRRGTWHQRGIEYDIVAFLPSASVGGTFEVLCENHRTDKIQIYLVGHMHFYTVNKHRAVAGLDIDMAAEAV